ncbi:hypothetical protein D9M72_520190 [compost metagenome]
MAEMVEPAIGAGHARGDLHPGAVQRFAKLPDGLGDRRRRPARIDEFMRQLHVADADLLGDGVDQVVGLGEAVDQRIGVERQREGHDLTPGYQ